MGRKNLCMKGEMGKLGTYCPPSKCLEGSKREKLSERLCNVDTPIIKSCHVNHVFNTHIRHVSSIFKNLSDVGMSCYAVRPCHATKEREIKERSRVWNQREGNREKDQERALPEYDFGRAKREKGGQRD